MELNFSKNEIDFWQKLEKLKTMQRQVKKFLFKIYKPFKSQKGQILMEKRGLGQNDSTSSATGQ